MKNTFNNNVKSTEKNAKKKVKVSWLELLLFSFSLFALIAVISFDGQNSPPNMNYQLVSHGKQIQDKKIQENQITQELEVRSLQKSRDADLFDKNKSDYANQLQEVFQNLPRRAWSDSLKFRTSFSSHLTSTEILESAEKMAWVADSYLQHPQFSDVALHFYTECVNDAEILPQFRAVCVERVQKISHHVINEKNWHFAVAASKEVLDLVRY